MVGRPGEELEPFVERPVDGCPDGRGAAVERVYDNRKTELGEDRSVTGQGTALLVAYLLEREGAFDPQVSKRWPSATDLHATGHDCEWTLWHVAVEGRVHHSHVSR